MIILYCIEFTEIAGIRIDCGLRLAVAATLLGARCPMAVLVRSAAEAGVSCL